MIQALKRNLSKLRKATEEDDDDCEDRSEAEMDGDHSGAGVVGTDCGDGAAAGADDEGNTGKDRGCGMFADNEGEFGAGSRGGCQVFGRSWV